MKIKTFFLIEVCIVVFLAGSLFIAFALPEGRAAKIIFPIFTLTDLRRVYPLTSKIRDILHVRRSVKTKNTLAELPKAECQIKILKQPKNIEVGKEYEIIFELSNVGADSSTHAEAFSGMHVEAVNADMQFVSSDRKMYQQDSVKWGEVKLGHMASGEKKRLVIAIVPTAKPVTIYYRGWIPGQFNEEVAKEVQGELVDSYKESGVWRSETTLSRFPANDEPECVPCRVKVKAAHKEYQSFNCQTLILR